MNKPDRFVLTLVAAAAICLLVLFASAAHSRPPSGHAVSHVKHGFGKLLSIFKKKKVISESDSEVLIEVEPSKSYSANLKRGQRLALVLDANDGRIWHIESRADKIVDERPEGKANVTYTTIFFTPREVDGEGDIVLKTKILENYPEDWSNADSSVIHITVQNAQHIPKGGGANVLSK